MKEYIVPIYDDSPNHDEIFVGYIRENATEIVRCKYCKLFETGVDSDCGWCNNWDHKTGENGFYHDAEKKVTE